VFDAGNRKLGTSFGYTTPLLFTVFRLQSGKHTCAKLPLKVQPTNLKIAHPTAERVPQIVRLLIDSRIGVDEDWSAQVLIEAAWDKRLAGCCALDFVERVAILHSLAIDKPMRRKGIGKALVERCVTLVASQQVCCIVALTMFWNVTFFRKCGFNTTSRKLLPACLANHPLVYHPVLQRATPMIRRVSCAELG
jgi:N-acetylglutamate synthase-like GNAT family acetyltransferase